MTNPNDLSDAALLALAERLEDGCRGGPGCACSLNDAAATLRAIVAARQAPQDVVEALRVTLKHLDGLITESGREIEWGHEDPFRMGEWFEPEDLAEIEAARAFLAALKGGDNGLLG